MKAVSHLANLAALAFLGSCAGVPKTDGRKAEYAFRDTSTTGLARAVRPMMASDPQASAFHSLGKGDQALDARLGLASMAERGLDIQYYIWHNDASGRQLIAGLLAAADRGVRVRVLIDDLGTSAKDESLLALDSHPKVEVRLFNPIMTRSARLLGTVFDFGRVNRRMHNKTFVADGQVAIIGGRNIGDEYFDVHGEVNFADYDLAAIGPAAREVSESFDAYWNSPSSIGITELTRQESTPESQAKIRAALKTTRHDLGDFSTGLRRGTLHFYPGRATVVADDPEKILQNREDTDTHLAPKLRALLGATRREMLIVSPYFIPGKNGVARLADLRRRGVRVIVLTNSLASTDVAAVHAGYKRYREEMLRAGVELYENKPSGAWSRGSGGGLKGLLGSGHGASSRASLHAKCFTFDRSRIFVGSMNLDPRSVHLNTEIGVLVESEDLASAFTLKVLGNLDANAYRVTLENRHLVWSTLENGQLARFTTEPQTSAWQRFTVDVLSWLPLENQL